MTNVISKEYFKQLDRKITLIPLSYDRVFKEVFKLNLDLLKKFFKSGSAFEYRKG